MFNLLRFKHILIISGPILMLIIIGLSVWLYSLQSSMKERLVKGWFLPPVEVYSAPLRLYPKWFVTRSEINNILQSSGFRERASNDKLFVNDYSWWMHDKCQMHLNEEWQEEVHGCLALKVGDFQAYHFYMVAFDEQQKILKLFSGKPSIEISHLELQPQLLAQFYNSKPILRRVVEVGQVPLICVQAVTAIEDNQFLTHQGVSFKGYARAAWNILIKNRIQGGGSTITQQLVKNYFLNSEQTFKRKLIEMFMSFILEFHATKDQIIENYLNVIYMGQNGPFEVRGFGAASQYYFSKKVEQLDLKECALLAAVLNSPGRYNPFRHPEKALTRRTLVLKRMQELGMISAEIFKSTKTSPLPNKPPKVLSEPAPYFVNAIYKELKKLKIKTDDGLKIYSTLNPIAQEAAQQAIKKGVVTLEKGTTQLKKLNDKGEKLQASLVSLDLATGGVIALVGGRSFKQTQYNRITHSHRQVGSIMKPFVYLTALESLNEDGQPYTPMTIINDEPFTYKYEGQKWSPRNYDKKLRGPIPLFYALKESLNIPTAQLGTHIGLNSIIDLVRRLGITSPIDPLPSLTLGAYELYPWEVAQAYSSIARMGLKKSMYYIEKVLDHQGAVIFANEPSEEQVIAAETAATLIGMLKQTVANGTGVSISTWRGFKVPSAGKTGTTSDTRDAWFAGFTPKVLAVVWVGYDKNHSHGLTGASGAIPIWTDYMKNFSKHYPVEDFNWPEGTEVYNLSPDQLRSINPNLQKNDYVETPLIFRTGNAP